MFSRSASRSLRSQVSVSSQVDVDYQATSIADVLAVPGNDRCADCGRKDPTWASCSFGVFLCDSCAEIHRRLETRISRVQPIDAPALWTISLIQVMLSRGNDRSRRIYEQLVPASYRRPTETDPIVLREEWIRSKYEREDFTDQPRQHDYQQQRPCDRYQCGRKEGFLWKRGREERRFRRRWFVLDESENTLRYYNQRQRQEVKGTFRLDELSISLIPDKLENPFGMQLTYEVCAGRTRNIYVYAQTGQEMVEWYSCIRWLKMQRLIKTHGRLTVKMLSTMLTQDFTKEGWLYKTGPTPSAVYRRRWMTLAGCRLRYQKEPLDAYSRGEIQLGRRADGYTVDDGLPTDARRPPPTASETFSVVTPWRRYCFAVETVSEKLDWINAIGSAIDRCSSVRTDSD